MNDDLLKSMFLRALDQYESATRWVFIVVLICILFHLTTFNQFVRLGKQLTIAQAEISRLSSLEPALANLKSNLNQLKGSATKVLHARLDGILRDLRSDFGALDRSIAEFRTLVTSEFTATTPEIPPSEDLPSNAVIQAPQTDTPRIKTFRFDEDTRHQIVEARNVDELRKVMLPVIEKEIVSPRFDQLNSYWRGEILPKITQQAKTTLEEVKEVRPLFPEGEALWDDIQQSVEQTLRAATTLQFRPPADPYWWASVSGKQVSLSNIEQAAAYQLRAVADSEAIAELSDQVRAAISQQERLQDSLRENLKGLKESFDEYQSRLLALGKPFAAVYLDVDVVASSFPLLLGIILAGLTTWLAYRLREIALPIHFMADKGGEKVLFEWFLVRTRLSLPRRQQAWWEKLLWGVWPERWSWMLGSLCRGLIYCVWIVVAAWQIAGCPDVGLARSAMFAAGGCLAVVATVGYRLHVIRGIRDISKSLP